MSHGKILDPSGLKRKHITLTIQEKIDIINLCDEGKVSRAAVAVQFGIGKSTVHDICKNSEKIRAFASDNSNEILKRRRVDQKLFKADEEVEQEEQTEETIIDSIEEYDYREIGVQDYEVVYETSYPIVISENSSGDAALQKTPKYTPSKLTRNSKTLTLKEKYDIIQQYEAGKSVSAIRQVYGIGRTTIYDFVKQKRQIYEFLAKSNENHQRRTFKKSKFPEVESRLVEWCNSQESYTKQQFNDRAKTIFDSAREEGVISSPSGFCGSWAWAKRFFHRNPGFEVKLRTPSGDLLDPSELSLTNVEYLDESLANENISIQLSSKSTTSGKRRTKAMSLAEKNQVLDEIDSGRQIPEIAQKFEVSKSVIYGIFKQRDSIRLENLVKTNNRQKMGPKALFPSLDCELVKWCAEQRASNEFLSFELLSDKAVHFFKILGLKGSINIGSWIECFLMRHPEIKIFEKFDEIEEESQFDDVKLEDVSFGESGEIFFEEEDEMSESLEFLEPDALTSDYQEECIIEELDSNHEDQQDTESSEENLKSVETIIPPETAFKSLRLLAKFCEQQGHVEMLSQLREFKTRLNP